MKYIKNNISYRIASSSAISKYKENQSYMLGELLRCNYTFGESSRDICLLNYQVWSKVGVEVEDIVLEITDEDVRFQTIKQLCVSKYRQIQTFLQQDTSFNRDKVNLFNSLTGTMFRCFIDRLDVCKHTNNVAIFTQFVDNIIEYTNSIVYLMHEIDYIIKIVNGNIFCCEFPYSNSFVILPFLSINNTSIRYYRTNGKFLEEEKFLLYKKELLKIGIESIESIILKVYVPVDFIGDTVDKCSPHGSCINELSTLLKTKYKINNIIYK